MKDFMLRELTIRPALNGWIVGVGCQSMVYILDPS